MTCCAPKASCFAAEQSPSAYERLPEVGRTLHAGVAALALHVLSHDVQHTAREADQQVHYLQGLDGHSLSGRDLGQLDVPEERPQRRS
jgi:hypothetical protein